jgi:hypothetical protein
MSLCHVPILFLSLFSMICLGLAACEQGGDPHNTKPDPITSDRSGGTLGTGGRQGGAISQPSGGSGTTKFGVQVNSGRGGSQASGGQVSSSDALSGQSERDAGTDTSIPMALGGVRRDARIDTLLSTDVRLDSGIQAPRGGSAGTFISGGAFATGGAVMTGGTTNMGGTAGQTGTCDFSDPPSSVSAWVEESWNSQLGSNVKNRKAWLLDSVVLGKGQINLCIRWGASTAPSAAVKTGMAQSVQKWFNDWFLALGTYGCFPYGSGNVTVKVTGWAVKPGNTDWVSDLGPDVKVYTETDNEGEPKCPDRCSFFTTSNWSHKFPNCAEGEDFHTDYWIWLDDKLPGSGAAAVGGDWGLRMPVSNFINSMGKGSHTIEHEIGHGFGFQDYYTWTGSRPVGGSLMIVGSGSGSTPTLGDSWLLRRTWKEVKALRNW